MKSSGRAAPGSKDISPGGWSRGSRWAPILVFIAVFALYVPSLNYPFVHNDSLVLQDLSVRSLPQGPAQLLLGRDVEGALSGQTSRVYRPLTKLSYALNFTLGGEDSFGYHLANNLLHAVNAVLVFFLLRLLLGRTWPAVGGALLFGVHPLQTEAVTWIAARSNVLFLSFCLGAFLLHVARRSRTGSVRVAFSAGVVLCFAGALLAQESAIVLPVLLLAYDWLLEGRSSYARRAHAVVYYVVLFLTLAVYLVLRHHVLGSVFLGTSFVGSYAAGAFTAMRAILDYLIMMVCPLGQSVEHPLQTYTSLLDPVVLAAAGLHLGMFDLAVLWVIRGERLAAFGLLWVYVALIPAGNIVAQRVFFAERHAYLAMVGVGLLVAVAVARIAGRVSPEGTRPARWRTATATGLTLLVLVSLTGMTATRNPDWKNPLRLLESASQVGPLTPKLHVELGVDLLQEGRLAEARQHFEEALRDDPSAVEARHYLAETLMRQKRYDRARKEYEELAGDRSCRAEDLAALARLQLIAGEGEPAQVRLERAVEIEPDNALLRQELDSTTRAVELLKQAREADREGRWSDAEQVYGQMVKAQSWFLQGYLGLARARSMQNKDAEAVSALKEWLKVDERCAQAHDDLGWVLATATDEKVRDIEGAVSQARRAVQLGPENGDYLRSLARFLFLSGREEEAATVLEEARRRLQHGP